MEKGDINNSKEDETKATAEGITDQGETKACTDPVNKNETEQSDENIYENIADYLK